MNGFSGINQFGSLTTQSGKILTFKNFDIDDDNKISEEELKQVNTYIEVFNRNIAAEIDKIMRLAPI